MIEQVDTDMSFDAIHYPRQGKNSAWRDVARNSYLNLLAMLIADEIIEDLGLLEDHSSLLDENKPTHYNDKKEKQDEHGT